MSNLIGKNAIVVGAGMGGLAAAKALSDHLTMLLFLSATLCRQMLHRARGLRRPGIFMRCLQGD
jgi:2-polyprenyl-6-methoxyphenol hydroxylase-like FAD-dependent oxidoreductase